MQEGTGYRERAMCKKVKNYKLNFPQLFQDVYLSLCMVWD